MNETHAPARREIGAVTPAAESVKVGRPSRLTEALFPLLELPCAQDARVCGVETVWVRASR
jgi:hypothetical protein